jgi:hypothetical protein
VKVLFVRRLERKENRFERVLSCQNKEDSMSVALFEETILNAQAVMDKAGDQAKKELAPLIKDLEEAKMTVFVKTAEAKPLLERCQGAASALRRAVESEGTLGEEAKSAFSSFERAVSKLRNAIMVRTQRAT